MPILVTDFDGTLTNRDYFQLILDRYHPPAAQEIWDGFKAGRLTHFEAIAGVFGALRTDLAGAEALVRELDPSPGLGPAVRLLQDAGWELQIASAGCGWYIERFLNWQGIEAELHACPGDFIEGEGLVMRPAVGTPFASETHGIDKPLEFSIKDMWPPFWEGRSLSTGDIDHDDDLDHVFARAQQVTGVAMLVAIPFTKLSHFLLFFLSRAQLGMDYGIKRGGMKSKGMPW